LASGAAPVATPSGRFTPAAAARATSPSRSATNPTGTALAAFAAAVSAAGDRAIAARAAVTGCSVGVTAGYESEHGQDESAGDAVELSTPHGRDVTGSAPPAARVTLSSQLASEQLTNLLRSVGYAAKTTTNM
jgi:hypothetical protein